MCFRRLLKCKHCCCLETIFFEEQLSCKLSNQALEWKLSKKQICCLLVSTNLPQCNSSRPELPLFAFCICFLSSDNVPPGSSWCLSSCPSSVRLLCRNCLLCPGHPQLSFVFLGLDFFRKFCTCLSRVIIIQNSKCTCYTLVDYYETKTTFYKPYCIMQQLFPKLLY